MANTDSSIPNTNIATPIAGPPAPEAGASDTDTLTPAAPATNPQAKIPTPPGDVTKLKAGDFVNAIKWSPDDFNLAHRVFREVYNKHIYKHREPWSQLPKDVVSDAIAALKEMQPRLFNIFEDDWYLIWGLYKRHVGRFRKPPPMKVAEESYQKD